MDLSSRGCLLNERDGLILSSFQILDQAENESTRDAKENRVLDHFLNSLSYENENHFKEENSQWKGSESLPSSNQAQNVSNPFPLDLDAMEDHDSAMLRNFQAQPVNREVPQNRNHPGSDNDIQRKNSDGEEENDDEEDEERRGIMHCQEQRSDLVKGLPGDDACNPIQLHEAKSEESSETKQMIPSHQTDYLDMQPVLSHHVYIDSATDDIWHQESTKNDFCSTLKPDGQQQHQHNDCLSASDWGDSGKGVTEKGELPPAVLENHAASQAQQWDFLHTDEHHEPTHHLLPPPPHHHHQHHHQPHHHWAAANINTGGIPAVNLSHQHQQHHGQQQQKQWVSGKNVPTWVHTHPGENGDKAMLPSSGQWSTHNTMAWHKEMGGSFSADTDVGQIHNMFQMTQTQSSDPSVSHTAFTDKGHTIVCNSAISLSPQQAWSMDSHLPTGSGTLYPHQGSHPTMVHCPQPSTTNFFQDPLHLSTASSSPSCHFQGASMQPIACNMSGDSKKARSAFNRRRLVSLSDASGARYKSAIDQLRPNSHPYLPKDPKIHRAEGYPSCGNSCNLKASHLISWYIDYLIHENENLTQISRAFSLPVNLFHSDDFYFMDSVKKKAHFPSLKFLSWMQQKMPSININSVDFLEGRPPVVSMWNQDWFWQNKSRRDIIHDVFFYFQHRRVAYPN